MIGIYKIVNKINNKIYIGQSVQVKERWAQHLRAVNNKNSHTYNYPLYKDMRLYGVESFVFELVEECNIEDLTKREQYWIDFYNSKVPYGYNIEDAIDPRRGEKCNFSRLSDSQAEEVKKLLSNTSIPMSEIGKMYGVSGSCIEDINKGRRRVDPNIDYPIRKKAKSLGHSSSYGASTQKILTTEEVITIRTRYVNETLDEIYEDYKSKISKASLKKICYGVTWKHLPVYKKREKKWINYYQV